MAKKSKHTEEYSVSIEGILNLKDMTIEVEDVGVKTIQEVLAKLDGTLTKLNAESSSDLA